MKQQYLELSLKKSTLALIETINQIIAEYEQQGFRLTVRQLYYQLVARDVIPNNEKSYKRVTKTVNDGRLAGLIDWDMIEDRTRDFIRRPSWTSPRSILESAAHSFHMDMWEKQDTRVFCVVEKEALVNVLERVCHRWDVPLLAARGYPSASVMREFAVEDVLRYADQQRIIILHLGDHDPSGIDMSRDLQDRINLFSERCGIEFHRLALNMDQISEQKPPPNPAKSTDTRFVQYRKKFGNESWELDALKPTFLEALVGNSIQQYVDMDAWNKRRDQIEAAREKIKKVAETI